MDFKPFYARRFHFSIRRGAELIAAACVAFSASGAALARDMMGVIDLSNHAVIPCTYKSISYVGCGLYLCEGFEKGPGTRMESLNFVPLGSLPEKAKESAVMHGSGNPKILIDRYGNKIKLEIPKGAALLNVFIPEKTKRAYLTDASKKTEVTGLPKDALLSVMSVGGVGVCDLQANYLIEPIYPALIIGSAETGTITAFQWDEAKKQLAQVKVPLKIPSQGSESKIGNQTPTDLPKAMQKAYEGMTVYRSPEGLYGYLDEQGKIAIPAKYYSPGHFSGGVAAVRLNPMQGSEKGQFCFIDKKGNIVSPIFWRIWGFYGDYALVAEKGEEPVGRGTYRRDLYGLIDRNYKFFLPLAPTTIRYLPEGYWVIGTGSAPSKVLDRQGNEVFRAPEHTSLFNDSADTHVFVTTGAGQRKLLYFDKDWKPVKEVAGEPAQYGPIPTLITVSGRGYDIKRAVVDGKGDFLIGPENAEFKPAEPDRYIKTVFGTTFVKEDWDTPNRDRSREFELFLRQYKLVGMKRAEVERLLGPASKQGPGANAVYTISGFGSWCGNSYVSVEIEYVGDKVSRWRRGSIGAGNNWNN